MKRFAFEFKWAAIVTACTVIWTAFEKSMGWHDELIAKHSSYSMLFGLVAIALYFFALSDKKRNHYDGLMNWTQGFLSGMVMTVMIAILTPLALYAALTSVSPDFLPNMKEYMTSSGKMTADIADKMYDMQSYIMYSVFFALSTGVVTSAIVALIVRSKKAKA